MVNAGCVALDGISNHSIVGDATAFNCILTKQTTLEVREITNYRIAWNDIEDMEHVLIMEVVLIHTSLPNLPVSSILASCKEYRKVPDLPMGRVPVCQTMECNPRVPEVISIPNGRLC